MQNGSNIQFEISSMYMNMYVISTLDANVNLPIYFIAYVATWKSRDMWVMLHKSSYICLFLGWNVFITNDCVWYVLISCIVVITILTCYRRVQTAFVFNKYGLGMYLQQEEC